MDLLACVMALRPDVTWAGNSVNAHSLDTIAETYQSAQPLPTLSECELWARKDQKMAELLSAYAATVYADIEYNTKTYTADADTQALLAQVLAVGAVPPGMYWRDKTGAQNTMTYADLQGLGGVILERGLIANAKLATKTAGVTAAGSVNDIDLIVW